MDIFIYQCCPLLRFNLYLAIYNGTLMTFPKRLSSKDGITPWDISAEECTQGVLLHQWPGSAWKNASTDKLLKATSEWLSSSHWQLGEDFKSPCAVHPGVSKWRWQALTYWESIRTRRSPLSKVTWKPLGTQKHSSHGTGREAGAKEGAVVGKEPTETKNNPCTTLVFGCVSHHRQSEDKPEHI